MANSDDEAACRGSAVAIGLPCSEFPPVARNTDGLSAVAGVNVHWIIYGLLLWYTSSICLTAINKILFDKLGFNYPCLVTFVHFAFMSLWIRIGFYTKSKYFPEFPQVSNSLFLKFIAPISFFSAVEIALTNLSYSMVSLSVITVIKSSLIVVTYFFSVICGLESFQWKLFGIILLIVTSISLSVPGMQIRDHWGVLCLCIAVLFAALRWVFVHQQLQDREFAPLQLMLLTQPLACIFLAPPAVLVDLRELHEKFDTAGFDPFQMSVSLILVTVASFLAGLLIFSEYNLVRNTSSVSLTVAGTGKEVLTIVMSTLGFKEEISWRVVSGIGFSIIGIIFYSHIRYADAKSHYAHANMDNTAGESGRMHQTSAGWSRPLSTGVLRSKKVKQVAAPIDVEGGVETIKLQFVKNHD